MSAVRRATRQITAFLDGPDDPSISNPIHSTEIAAQFGFRAALVGGVTVYGWCVPPILEAVGEGWLAFGWADIHFRRPVFPGDQLTITVTGDEAGAGVELVNAASEICLRGEVGAGVAPWSRELRNLPGEVPVPESDSRTELTPAVARSLPALRPMHVPWTDAEASAYAGDFQRDGDPRWHGPAPRLHPGWVAARMTPLLKHTYWYGPSIHARSQIQHLRPASAGSGVDLVGAMVDAFERNGHEYAVLDGALRIPGEAEPFAVIRHTTIYRPARRDGTNHG